MNSEPLISKKTLLSILVYSIIFVCTLFIFASLNKKTVIAFCGVKNGDSTYIRVNNATDILIDAGDSMTSTCLGKYMPFYDKTIEYAFITYARKDQYDGYRNLADRYKIKQLYMLPKKTSTMSLDRILKALQKSGTRVINNPISEPISIDDSRLISLWPNFKTNGSNVPTKYLSYTLVFIQRNKAILILGRLPETELSSLPNLTDLKPTVVKFSEYGLSKSAFSYFSDLADKPTLLINQSNINTYPELEQNLTKKISVKIVNNRTDVVYRF